MRNEMGALRRGVLALALSVLPTAAAATTADDLCAPTADPCVVSTAVAVTNGSTIDVRPRTLRIAAGGILDVGAGTMTLLAGTLTVDANGALRALGNATTSGGTLTATADIVTIAGTVDASGAPSGGSLTIIANNTLTASGSISARALARTAIGGSVQLTAGSATLSGPISVVGGFDSDGGDVSMDITSGLTVTANVDASGGDGGSVEILVGTAPAAGNLSIGAAAILRADATTAGGFGGSVEVTAHGDGTATGTLTINGLLSATGRLGSTEVGGGSGGCIDVEGSGDVRVEGASARLTAEGGAPDGDGGEVGVTSDLGAVILGGHAQANVQGAESSGGAVTVDSTKDSTVSGTLDVTAGDGGGGEIAVTSLSGSITVTTVGVINASSDDSGDGGAVCLEGRAGSVVVEGTLESDGSNAASGGSIDLLGGASVRISSMAVVHASGGVGGGQGGTVTLAADPGNVLIEAELAATGGNPGGTGGTISLDAVGRINVGAPLDGSGFGAGGQIGLSADAGPIDILDDLNATTVSGPGGSIEVNATKGDVHVGGVLSDTGTVAGGLVEIIGCNITVCGTASSSCPASAGVGQLNSLGPSGINRVTGRSSSVILGQMHANPGSGRNELVYDGMPAHEPLVLGQVNPAPVLVTDASLTPCAEVTPVPVICPGDCSHDGSVSVDELIKGVNIALGNADLSTCPEFDTDGSGAVEISELIAAVNAALNGCPVT
jgi:hypothetical protein